mgnify:CR=1 FL=1
MLVASKNFIRKLASAIFSVKFFLLLHIAYPPPRRSSGPTAPQSSYFKKNTRWNPISMKFPSEHTVFNGLIGPHGSKILRISYLTHFWGPQTAKNLISKLQFLKLVDFAISRIFHKNYVFGFRPLKDLHSLIILSHTLTSKPVQTLEFYVWKISLTFISRKQQKKLNQHVRRKPGGETFFEKFEETLIFNVDENDYRKKSFERGGMGDMLLPPISIGTSSVNLFWIPQYAHKFEDEGF